MFRLLFLILALVCLTEGGDLIIRAIQIVNDDAVARKIPDAIIDEPTDSTQPPLNETALREEISAEEEKLNQTLDALRNITQNITQNEDEVKNLNDTITDLEEEKKDEEDAADALEDLLSVLGRRRRLRRRISYHPSSSVQGWQYCPNGLVIYDNVFQIVKKALTDIINDVKGDRLKCLIGFLKKMITGIENGDYVVSEDEKDRLRERAQNAKEAEEKRDKGRTGRE